MKSFQYLSNMWGALILAGLVFFTGCGGFGFEVKIPKALIIKQVDRKFPTVKSKGLMTVKLSNPVLDFQGSRNRLGVVADAEVRILGLIPLRGEVICDGSVLYQPKNGAFQFTDVKVKKFTFKDLPSSRADEVSGLIGTAALAALGGLEIYKLNPKDSQEKLAKLTLKGIRVTDDGIVARLGLGQE